MQIRTNPISFRDQYNDLNIPEFYINYIIPYMINYTNFQGQNVFDEIGKNLKKNIFLDKMPDDKNTALFLEHKTTDDSTHIETIDIFFDLYFRDELSKINTIHKIELDFRKICNIFRNKSTFNLVSISSDKIINVVFTDTILPITAMEDEIPNRDSVNRMLYLSSFLMRLDKSTL